MRQFILFSVCLLGFTANNAHGLIVSTVGDKDGFGGVVADAVPADGTRIWPGSTFNNNSGSDLPFMDRWSFEQSGGSHASPLVYSHDYLLSAAVSATLVIQEAGMGDSRGPWDVIFNDVSIGMIGEPGKSSTDSYLHSFVVPISLLTGSDTITLDYLSTRNEGYAINFSELTIVESAAVPEPASLLIWISLATAGAFIRKRKLSARA